MPNSTATVSKSASIHFVRDFMFIILATRKRRCLVPGGRVEFDRRYLSKIQPMRFAPVLLALVTLVSTGLGGTAAIRLRDRLHLLLGFSSGAVLAVALFDILPEVFAFDHGASYMPITALGFLAFFGLERYTAMHRAREHPHSVGDS